MSAGAGSGRAPAVTVPAVPVGAHTPGPVWNGLRRALATTGHTVVYGVAGERSSAEVLLAVARRLLPDRTRDRLAVARGPHRRPHLVDRVSGRPVPVDVNLSHTADLVVVGVARTGGPPGTAARIGVDVERVDRLVADRPGMLARFTAPVERRRLAAVPDATRTAAVSRLWTCKEAVAKADGRGLGLDLRTVVPEPGHDGHGEVAAVRGGARAAVTARLVAHPARPGERYWIATALLYHVDPGPGLDRKETA
ncbi:4'-phosphopantetheinyl transferase superfamily protein [Pseudonocardia tropica]|uniref:4'-phosphopantetheinyl transferase superfamily protein n=1 Tax=Pseudonocardia tropica TaxID=681289 RepID=A0ABV1JUP6_9PSEU